MPTQSKRKAEQPTDPEASGARTRRKPLTSESDSESDATNIDFLECTICLAHNAPTASGRFKCVMCHLRGDLSFTDPINVAIRQAITAPSIQQAAPSAPSTPTTQIHASKPRKTLWEEALTSALEAQRDVIPEMFSPAASSKPHDHEKALSTSRLSYGATACQNPHPLVVQLIRTGRLDNVGHAIPHLRPLGPSTELPKEGTMPLGQGGGVKANTAQREPPPLSTPLHFISALLSTILPSLVDMPDAFYEWLAFARTIFEIHRMTDWETAVHYMNQIVPERINHHEIKSGVLAQLDMTMLMNAQASSKRSSSTRSATPSTPPRGGGICRDWNLRQCRRESCGYRHDCLNLASSSPCQGGHKLRDCPEDDRKQQHPEASSAPSTPSEASTTEQ